MIASTPSQTMCTSLLGISPVSIETVAPSTPASFARYPVMVAKADSSCASTTRRAPILCAGGTFISARRLRIERTSSIMRSIRAQSSLYALNRPSTCGQAESMIVGSSESLVKISSVMNGINGCSSFRLVFSTWMSTALTAAFSAAFSPYRRDFAISMYQSQYSDQMKS
ncbi:hypothetical protein SDC9_187084 [bioreactor metagenome]|uniref:Uncharacterized protein n=1 Tax=bioreactor metagenome TaxID=1076179 RepID=A0A645HLY7_9ZZZZ